MALSDHLFRNSIFLLFSSVIISKCNGNDVLGCGGFVKSHVALDFSKIEIGLYTKSGSLKERTECAPTNGYYFLPLYEKGEYILKVHPPPGWSFEPSEVNLVVDGSSDQCSTNQDINFSFNGFGITGRVITAGQSQGPSGIAVQLVNDKGEKRDTITATGGDFHFTPVIPGKYTLKASHPRWKLDPARAIVQVKEGNTALPVGVLAVKGYDVKGSVTSYGSPIAGVYVLLYSKEENPKFRVEGCNTALLQGVPDAPICHAVTDHSGEFSFGLVPAGEYRLLALAKPPSSATIRYNIKPETVSFSVLHDSLFIKNAFEVTGFTVIGSVLASSGGSGVSGARVLQDGKPVATTDSVGKFTLPSLQPGTYTLSFQHEQCQFSDIQLSVSPAGPASVPTALAAAWRVCGAVAPPGPSRSLAIHGDKGLHTTVEVTKDDGKWCTFLPPGVYSAKVEVTEAEQREGLQFYPLTQKITVAAAPVAGVVFSQLKAQLSGTVQCQSAAACRALPVTLRPLSPDGGYVGQPMSTTAIAGVVFSQLKAQLSGTVQCQSAAACRALPVTLRPLSPDGGYVGQPMSTTAIDGKYTFSEVLPGSVEVSVPAVRLCWVEARHNVAVASEQATVPPFEHSGYVLRFKSSHAIEVEYTSKSSKGTLQVPAGSSQQCVSAADSYTLTPRGPHRFQPPQATADTTSEQITTVQFLAVAHAVVFKVLSPEPVPDLVLKIRSEGGVKEVGPLVPLSQPEGGYSFEHTLFMTPGEVAVVSAQSASLLFVPAEPVQLVGRGEAQAPAATVRAVPGLTLRGALVPPTGGVLITLTDGEMKLTQTTTEDGTYRFGPLDASKHYTITAEKESYVFGERDESGNIAAHRLAEITVELVDDADDTPLQGALVSVSGGSYRHVAASGGGPLRFPALHPNTYYVKPNMKEYRFTPPHTILEVHEGKAHHLKLRGVRVAWSCLGRVVSLGGAGWAGAALAAAPVPGAAPHCAHEEATTDASGAFRIRGLLPKCVYTLQLKESNTPDTYGLKLAKAPPTLEVKQNKDIENVRLIAVQPTQITDVNVLIYTPLIEHYKSLRLTLALEATPHTPLYATKLDSTGFSQHLNPGLMYVLPRLPADNKTYVLQLESSLSKATHSYGEIVHYFNSDGKFKSFNIDFLPKMKSLEQELRQTSLLVVPLLGALVLGYLQRQRLLRHLQGALARAAPSRPGKGGARQETFDRAAIDHIVSALNPPKKPAKRKVQ